mgnify:CR=1 FL=1
MGKPTLVAYDLFHRGSLALAEVEAAGIRIDVDYLDRAIKKTTAKVERLKAELKEDEVWAKWKQVYGNESNLGSGPQLGHVLFDVLKHPCKALTPTGKPKTDEKTLEAIDVPFVKKLFRIKKLEKAKSTYLVGLKKEVVDGFIHPVFNLHTVETYRSCVAKGTFIDIVRDVSKHPFGIPIEKIKVGDYVYCYDDNLNLAIKKVLWVGKTGRKRVLRLHWNARGKHGHLDLTPEHKVRLPDGRYLQARYLGMGDCRTSSDSKHCAKIRALALGRVEGDDRIYPTGKSYVLDHRFVYEQMVGPVDCNKVVHHKDNNHFNNIPSNLEALTKSEHASHHASECLNEKAMWKGIRKMQERWRNGEIEPKVGPDNKNWIRFSKTGFLKLLAESKGRPTKTGFDYGTIIGKAKHLGVDWGVVKSRYDKNWDYISLGRLKKAKELGIAHVQKEFGVGYYRAKKLLDERGLVPRKICRNQFGEFPVGNHKIVKIEYLDEDVDVYDLEVEGVNNFIANEICVHNSADSPNLQNWPIRHEEMGRITRRCIVPRKGRALVEVDFSALEFKIAACFWKDPAMIKYASNPKLDVHRDMAAACYMLPVEEVEPKGTRFYAKNQFVFPILYGSYYVPCAQNLWNAADRFGLKTKSGVPIKKWLAEKGIKELGVCDPKVEPRPGTFERHVKKVEDRFNAKFPVFAAAKEQWYADYRENGGFPLMTGFWVSGIRTKNFCMNCPVQGPAFHVLLWCLIELVREIREREMKSLVIGEIHDCILGDVILEERHLYLRLIKKIMTKRVRRAWDWIVTPLDVEVEVARRSWAEKEKWVERNGEWGPER